ncbi:hypothetical protein [Paenibacillus sp. FSL H3-0333]|uniref:hypothetical protein n=1 Tax=Paenibacillus sp. FSL H3-0333 TaxID=2921373 RepID=UPI0030F63C94
MTPERIKDIKTFLQTLDSKCELAEWLEGLLIAIEETEQLNRDKSHDKDTMKFMNDSLSAKLIEAQKFITQLETELEEMTIDRNIWRSNSTDWDGQEELVYEEGDNQ